MLEILITLLVLSIGLLGMAALQARGQQAEMESYQRSQALILLEDMSNRMNTNRQFRDCYNLDTVPVGYYSTYTASGCDARADTDIAAWESLLQGAAETLSGASVGAMIGARGCIVRLASNTFEITVAWQGLSPTIAPATNTCAQNLYGNDALRRVVTRTVRFATLD
jgi:type IV pilus assembly protein PilV